MGKKYESAKGSPLIRKKRGQEWQGYRPLTKKIFKRDEEKEKCNGGWALLCCGKGLQHRRVKHRTPPTEGNNAGQCLCRITQSRRGCLRRDSKEEKPLWGHKRKLGKKNRNKRGHGLDGVL